MITVTVRFFAGARAAADGTHQVQLPAARGSTVGDILDHVRSAYPRIDTVLPACSFLLDGVSSGLDDRVEANATLDVLPPFSGG